MRTMYNDKITPPPSAAPLKIKRGPGGIVIPEGGFTLVELMITMAVFVLAMVAASNIFTGILTQFKQQSRIAESNIAGIVGLEMLRHDVEQAGIGLPWNLNGVNYNEAAVDTAANDDNGGTNSNPPRPVVVLNDTGLNNSDVLVIKATNVGMGNAPQKWTYITNTACTATPPGSFTVPNMLRNWGTNNINENQTATTNNAGTDHVIIINPSQGAQNQNVLQNNGGVYDVQLNDGSFTFNGGATPRIPFEPNTCTYPTYVAYDISPTAPLRMPFNRADFYIKRPADISKVCEPSTGILYKGTVNHGTTGSLTEYPLLDCVLDMQVVLELDTTGSGAANMAWGLPADVFALTPLQIRDQVKEIRIYLVVQEGQKDTSFTYTNNQSPPIPGCTGTNMLCINDIGGTAAPGLGLVKAVTVPDLNYRWKLHTIVVTPYNLK